MRALVVALLCCVPSVAVAAPGAAVTDSAAMPASNNHEWGLRFGLVGGGPSIGAGVSLRAVVPRFDFRISLLPGVARGYQLIDLHLDWGQSGTNSFVWGLGPSVEFVFDQGFVPRVGAGGAVGWRHNAWLLEFRTDIYLVHIGPSAGLWTTYWFGSSSVDP